MAFSKKRILFIVNPISGGFNKVFIPNLIDKNLDHQKFDAKIIYTTHQAHAKELAQEAVTSDIEIVVAVGGDGTINEVAGVLESSNKIMAIVPCGSGNGLARTLGISLNNAKAIQKINDLKTTAIDVGLLNNKKFFNMAGMGFDAHISAHFAKSVKRGLLGYIKSTLKEISNYKAQTYEIIIDGKSIIREAFMLSLANSSQYGNNAHISPTASTQDGLLDICIIKQFPLRVFPILGYRMFTKTASRSKYVAIIKAQNFEIIRTEDGPVHVDGEPFSMGKKLTVGIKPLALKIIV
ncbi:diacylglycerol/lipid kinase family protein [Pedobacter arcticus]|uniref:diacylglycerol/lipid kinase family protein n=1 Tax=Pedobacter arcticus TaxID=752140 RepID=UPI000300C043|nr:diacylglycerol kinase family protein [Pedobacter arcticus]